MIVFPPKYQIRLLDMDRAFVAIQASDFQTEVAGVYVFQFIKYLTYTSDKKFKLVLINIKLHDLNFYCKDVLT